MSDTGPIEPDKSLQQVRSSERLPAEDLQKVTAENIWRAFEALAVDPNNHSFGPSTDFDVIAPNGDRVPPKAVFGLAASEALGFPVEPKHFSGGVGTVCFRALERAGYIIVRKGEEVPKADPPLSYDDREWAEGRQALVTHLRRERAP